MAKKKFTDTTTKRGLGAIVGRMDDNIQLLLETTPKMHAQINHILTWEENVKMIPAILGWSDKVNLIPAIFEEVGTLRTELEELKRELKGIKAYGPRLGLLEKCLARVEAKISG